MIEFFYSLTTTAQVGVLVISAILALLGLDAALRRIARWFDDRAFDRKMGAILRAPGTRRHSTGRTLWTP
jgi:hypothetical protein